VNAAKYWCFTINNFTLEIEGLIAETSAVKCPIIFYSEEKGASGTPHLQGYLEFTKKDRPLPQFKAWKAHWEGAKGSRAENVEYTTKENPWKYSRGVEAPYKVTIPGGMKPWQQKLCDMLDTEPHDRKIYWLWEASGRSGKTTLCKWICQNKPHAVCVDGKAGDMKYMCIAYHETHGVYPKIILVDIPRSFNLKYLSHQGLEQVKNMFFMSTKYKCEQVCHRPPHMICFANESPMSAEMSADRWVVEEVPSLTAAECEM